MKTLAKRIERLEQQRYPVPPVVFLDREPEPGEFHPNALIFIDDIGSDEERGR